MSTGGSSLTALFKFIFTCWKLNLAGAMEFRLSFLLTAGMMMFNNCVWLFFWGVFFHMFNNVKGWGLQDLIMLWAVACAGFGIAGGFFGNTFRIANIVATGNLDIYLSQPKPVLLNLIISRMSVANLGDFIFGIIAFAIYGHQSFASWGIFLVSLVLIAIIYICPVIIVQSLAFFIGSAEGVSQQYTNALLTFSLYPIDIFKGWGKIMLFTVVPAGFVSFVPVGLIRDLDFTFLLKMSGVALLLLVASAAIFRLGLKRYSSGNMTSMRM